MHYECPRCRGAGSHALIAGPGRAPCIQCQGAGVVYYTHSQVESLARWMAVKAGRAEYEWRLWQRDAVEMLQVMKGR